MLKPGPSLLFTDSKDVIDIVKRGTASAKSRHYAIRIASLVEWQRAGKIELRKIPTEENPADLLTKPLKLPLFKKHAEAILGGKIKHQATR